MLKNLYIIQFLFIGIAASAQTTEEKIADYKQQIEDTEYDTTKIRLLCELSRIQRQIDLTAAKQSSQKALDLAISVNNKIYTAFAIGSFCPIYYAQGEYDKSLTTAKKGISILNADTTDFSNNTVPENQRLGNLFTSIGMAYDYKSEYTKAIQNDLKAKEAYAESGYAEGECVTHNNLGISYMYLGDLEKASQNFTYAYEKSMAIGDTNSAYQLKINIAVIAHHKQEYEKAKQIYLECAKNFEQLGNLRSLSNAYSNLGETYGATGQVDSSIYYIKKAVEIDEQYGDPQSILTSYIMLGTAYSRNKRYKEADEKYNQALEMALELGQFHDIESAYQKLANLAQDRGDYKKAIEYYVVAERYSDSIQFENNNRQLGKIEAEHEFNKQLAITETENEQKLKIEEEKRRRQSMILYISLGFIGVIMFFIYMLIKSLRQTRKQKELVEQANLEIEQKNEEMVASITYAKRIQNAILPANNTIKKHLPESFVLYEPKDIVAGDFYWLETKNDTVLFAAADCTGHGVPGAMVSVVCNNGLNRSVREYGLTDPGEILNKTREIVIQEFEKSEDDVKDGMDIALCAIGPSTDSGIFLNYAGAHNPLWIIRNGKEEIEEIRADKQPIGKFEGAKPYTSHEVKLAAGDQIYVFSDGFSDQFGGEKGKKYKASNFKNLLLSLKDHPMDVQKEKLLLAFKEWKGNLEQLDDVCIIGLRV